MTTLIFGSALILAFFTGFSAILSVVAYLIDPPLTEFSSAVNTLNSYIWLLDPFLPVTELARSFVFAFSVAFAVFTLKTGFYVIALLRGNSMPSGSK